MAVAVANDRQWAIVSRMLPTPRVRISSAIAPVTTTRGPPPFSQTISTSVQSIPRFHVVPRLRNTDSFAAQIAVKCSVVCDFPLQWRTSRGVYTCFRNASSCFSISFRTRAHSITWVPIPTIVMRAPSAGGWGLWDELRRLRRCRYNSRVRLHSYRGGRRSQPMSDPGDLLADLTDDQRAAVTHGEGPLLLLAGAGPGQTRGITRRVAYLLAQGVKPWSIRAITFTNKAAGEMRGRVEQLVPGNKVWVSTFHSLGARLLRQYADRLGFDRNFTIYDTDDRSKLVKDALAASGIDDVKFSPERIAGAIGKANNQLITPPQYERTANDFFSQTVSKVYHAYEKRLRQANAMDFDDLLYLPAMALKSNEELRA